MTNALKWGIWGVGTVSRHFAQSLKFVPGAKLWSVLSRSAGRAEQFAAEFGATNHYTDPDAFLCDRNVDAVYIATPSSLHHEHALLAIGAGKPVVVEKPFAISGHAAAEVAAAARAADVFCMEGMWTRFIPIIREARELLRQGHIGEVRMFEASLGFAVPYDPKSRYYDPALGGGALLDLGIYPLSLAYFLLGAPQASTASSVLAATGVDEQTCMLLSYEKALASLSCTFASRMSNNARIIATGGTMCIDAPLYAPTRLTVSRSERPIGSVTAPRLIKKLERASAVAELRRRFAPKLRTIISRNVQRMTRSFAGHGYQFEAAEVARCLCAGERESPLMPLNESVEILEAIDRFLDSQRGHDSRGQDTSVK
jgi:predicted dehydrogenase